MEVNVSAFSPVRNNSVSSDDSDGKTTIHFPKSEASFSSPPHPYSFSWWNQESSIVKQPLWSWWGLQSHRLPNFYRFPHFAGATDDEKPTQSYIGLIAEAILSSPEEKLILSDIYGFILANYPYFRNKGTGWRNSIRHNLSLNDCFVKAGRSQNGKGHFWAVSHLYIDDFRRGDFRRKRTYRRPSRAKKPKARLEALKIKNASNLLDESSEESRKHSLKILEDDMEMEETRLKNKLTATESVKSCKNNTEEKKDDDYMKAEHSCGELREGSESSERLVPSSPEWKPEDTQENHVDFEKKSYSGDSPALDEKEEIEEVQARSHKGKSFDVDALLAADRGTKDLSMLRDMYPMYYNVMNIGLRNPREYYGPSPGYCGHCCSMLGSFPSHHGEVRRPMYTMASYSTAVPLVHEGCTREYVE